MVSDLLTILAKSRSFIDVHGMSEIKKIMVYICHRIYFSGGLQAKTAYQLLGFKMQQF